MKIKIFITLLIFQTAFGYSQNDLNSSSKVDFSFQAGDFIFQDLDCDICDAVELVTQKEGNPYSFSHMALVVEINGQMLALEAIGQKVQTTSIVEFSNRSKNDKGQNKIVHARLRKQFSHLNKKAIEFAVLQVGKPYDDAFEYGNEAYYCSELIYDAYKHAQNGIAFFQLSPMTFKKPNSSNYFETWIEYFQKLGLPIPEGELGCNPNGIFEDGKFEIIKAYY